MDDTREIRLSAVEIVALRTAARRRISALGRSISTAEAQRSKGRKIQEGTLRRNYDELATLAAAAETLEAARKQIARQIAARLGVS